MTPKPVLPERRVGVKLLLAGWTGEPAGAVRRPVVAQDVGLL